MDNSAKKPNPLLKSLTWWKVEQKDLSVQIEQYHTLSIWKASRKVSAMLLVLSFAITSVLMALGTLGTETFVDLVIVAFLSIFVFQGHRWALVLAMMYWTISKVYSIATHPASLIVSIIWWAAYMQQFYIAYLVENKRQNPMPPRYETAALVSGNLNAEVKIENSVPSSDVQLTSKTLRELKQLMDDGVISRSDFEEKKNELIRKIG